MLRGWGASGLAWAGGSRARNYTVRKEGDDVYDVWQ